MKRTFLFLLAAILLGAGLWSCDKENNNGDDNGGNGNGTTSVQWVDLGLPSGLLWADRNVGAESPEDYGNYYAWGETAPKEVYDWSTYAYGNDDHNLTKYSTDSYYGPNYSPNSFTDNLTTLEASDDAATVNIGGKARMPRDYEWQELKDNTTSTWTTQNGVYGCLLTASNGKSIFLPAAGCYYGSTFADAGEGGSYWSSTLYSESPDYAWGFIVRPDFQDMGIGNRSYGSSVRAVRDSQN